jgi:hypothetical protein
MYKIDQPVNVKDIIDWYSINHTRHLKTPCDKNLEFCNVVGNGTYSNHYGIKV